MGVDNQLGMLLEQLIIEFIVVGGEHHAIEAGKVFGG